MEIPNQSHMNSMPILKNPGTIHQNHFRIEIANLGRVHQNHRDQDVARQSLSYPEEVRQNHINLVKHPL